MTGATEDASQSSCPDVDGTSMVGVYAFIDNSLRREWLSPIGGTHDGMSFLHGRPIRSGAADCSPRTRSGAWSSGQMRERLPFATQAS